ncbi:MAG: Fic family protein [Proteobacteria bacterium]|nr:Fic family protein [Pseudomonadota bacterium]MBU4381956.1 Fic family protein [Pseudomonadota bacterium]MCG2765576.1 Fic family protein [Desulfarculaceae bacterium]
MTFKSGQFAFSANYDRVGLTPLIIEARVLRQAVEDLPVLPAVASSLEEETIRRSIFSTAALEGNPLNEEQVAEVLDQKHEHAQREQAENEISNLKVAYLACRELKISDEEFRISENLIKSIHKTITHGLEHPTNTPGVYREHSVKVGNREHGGVYTPPKILPDIEKLMGEFISWINYESLLKKEPLLRAALAHFHFAAIHPFADGNGRTARLLESVILRADGVRYVPAMLSNYYYNHMDEYYWAFSRSERNKENDRTPFVEFVLQSFIASLREIQGKLTTVIRQLAMRDYIFFLRAKKEITQRQADLLNLLIEHPRQLSLLNLSTDSILKPLYRQVTGRTARRDLDRLKEKGLLLENNKLYRLNLNLLDHT